MNKFLNIYIFGDSLVLCDRLNLNQKWTKILKSKIKKKNNKVNMSVRAINGVTTTEALKKINFKVNSKSIVLILFGANDSVYYKSKKGKPRTTLKLFFKNYVSIIKRIRSYDKKCKIFLLNGHKFYRRRLEGNKKTHNFSFIKYKNIIKVIAKKTQSEILDTYSFLLNYKPKKYCIKLPDGLHQNIFG